MGFGGLTAPLVLPARDDAVNRPARTAALPDDLPAGMLHSFHQESGRFGKVTSDRRRFIKDDKFEGRLSLLSEAEIHRGGVHRYLVQFTAGQIASADGVGFVFANTLPCCKNIQKITSIFLNQRGQVCTRVLSEVVKESHNIKQIKIGDWVELAIDLDACVATFNVWPRNALALNKRQPDSSIVFNYGRRLAELTKDAGTPAQLDVGYLTCVVKNVGTTLTIAS